ncbi:unnamed protein product [Aureobasidium pullulans]|nr:unnamed protein product [Aureobasidium pullulans]
MRFQVLTALVTLAATAFADVEFTSPAAGVQIPGGTAMTITWTDDGTSPTIDQFSAYTLNLMAGGATSASVAVAATIKTNVAYVGTTGTITFTVPLTAGKTSTNGYFLQMVSVGVDGGQDIVYSKRFGLTGMTGTFSAAQIAGITAVGSSTAAGLPAAHNLAAAAATGAAAIGGEMYTVPYHLQTGLIKYAPIQPMPGTKITAKTPSMMNPSTSFTIFKTYAPPATITYTATESQTFTASIQTFFTTASASAATQPTAADMKKYLNRWKD